MNNGDLYGADVHCTSCCCRKLACSLYRGTEVEENHEYTLLEGYVNLSSQKAQSNDNVDDAKVYVQI